MPQPKNTALRIIIPLIALAVGGLVVYSSLKSPTNATSNPAAAPSTTPPLAQPATQPASPIPPTTPPATPPSTTQPPTQAQTPAPTTDQPATAQPAAPTQALASTPLRARIFNQASGSSTPPPSLGSLDKKGDLRAFLAFSNTGSGLKSLQLSQHFNTIKEEKNGHTELQAEHSLKVGSETAVLTPFAALAIEITPQSSDPKAPLPPQVIELAGSAASPLWSPVSGQGQGAFEAFIEDASGNAVLRLERKYVLSPNSSDIRLLQRAENLTTTPLTIRWFQFGPVDLPPDDAGYGGEKRHLRFGYLFPTERDPSRFVVTLSGLDKTRHDVLEKRYLVPNSQNVSAYRDYTLWPNPESIEGKYEPAWLAFTNRYFGVSVHALYTPSIIPGQAPIGGASPIPWLGQVDRVVLDGGDTKEVIGLRLISRPIALAAVGTGQSVTDLSHGIYAGPLNRREINAEPLLSSLNLQRIVVYNFGGPCGWCTFDSLTGLLLWVLHWLHDLIFRDWALAIIFLVVIVRGILHPVTRWTQIKMNRFSKQMQAVAPKQKILQEKYASDPAKLQQETAKLWREEGISPAGFLGCLPSFLQSPVWIALSAVLFFAVELRHQGGFYHIFQKIQPESSPFWYFLGDLAEPDRLVYFERTLFNAPLLGPITSINLLPLLLGVVFFLQQKYLTPPSATPLTPEQEMQQKIIKYMTVIMFPVMMYNAPAGLTLYFVVNSTLAIFESRWIRAYMDKHGLLDLDKMRAERLARQKANTRPGQTEQSGGFLSAIQKYAQKAQEQEKERRFGQDKPKR